MEPERALPSTKRKGRTLSMREVDSLFATDACHAKQPNHGLIHDAFLELTRRNGKCDADDSMICHFPCECCVIHFEASGLGCAFQVADRKGAHLMEHGVCQHL